MINRLRIFLGILIAAVAHQGISQSVVVAGSLNGVINPTQYAGSDIGAKVNTAWQSGKTVRIPWGTYNFSTTILHPGQGYELQCDAGAVLNYTGSGDAIALPNNNIGGGHLAGIDGEGGCLLQGTSSAQSGIHIYPSGHTFVRNMRIWGFTNANHGYGIYDTGGNSVEINNVDSESNTVGIYLTGSPIGSGYAANGVHIEDSEISSNSTWGVISADAFCACTQNLGNVISNNVLEGNGSGDLYLSWDYGTTVSGNYFESPGVNIELGDGQNVWGINVTHNYFTGGTGVASEITINWGSGFNITENTLNAKSSSACFVNVVTRSGGGSGGKRGVGTNFVPAGNEWCDYGVGTTTP